MTDTKFGGVEYRVSIALQRQGDGYTAKVAMIDPGFPGHRNDHLLPDLYGTPLEAITAAGVEARSMLSRLVEDFDRKATRQHCGHDDIYNNKPA
jgi:hypothetical protein